MKVSIITATYNSADTILDCITSVYNQSYPNIEHIIVDGDSKDKTLEVIKSIPSRICKIISGPDRGIYDAMNKGIYISTGDIVGFLNSDDQFFDHWSIERIVNRFEIEDIDALYGNLIFTNKQGNLIRTWKSNKFRSGLFAKSWCPAHPTFYCKRNLYENLGLYKTDYLIAADVELMLRFMEVNKIRTSFIDDFLVKMRIGGVSNQGLKSIVTITREMKRAFKENGLPFHFAKYLFYKGLKAKELL